MTVEPINSYLSRAGKIAPPKVAIRKEVQKVLIAEVGASPDLKEISVRGDTVYVKAPPVFKSEFFLKKKKILEALARALGPAAPRDIR